MIRKSRVCDQAIKQIHYKTSSEAILHDDLNQYRRVIASQIALRRQFFRSLTSSLALQNCIKKYTSRLKTELLFAQSCNCSG